VLPVVALFVLAALPVRMWFSIGIFRSLSLLDLGIPLLGALVMLLLLKGEALRFGDSWILFLLCVPIALTLLSFLWTVEPAETLRSTVIYVEAIVAYCCTVALLSGASSEQLIRLALLFVALLIAAGILLLLRIPGFEPQGISETDSEYLVSYYARLSHPFLGRSNNIATVLAFFVFPLTTVAWARKSFLLYVAAATVSVAILLTLSRGVILSVVLVALFGACLSAAALRRVLIGLVFGVPVIISGAFWALQRMPVALTYLEDRLALSTISSRLGLLDIGIENIASRPLLGAGAGASVTLDRRLVDTAHNTFIEQMLNFGIPLGVLCGVALVSLVLRLKRLSRSAGPTSGIDGIWLAVLCQLVIFLSQASFEGAILKIIFYLSIAWAVALIAAFEREQQSMRTASAAG
jgi:hypothetical protein